MCLRCALQMACVLRAEVFAGRKPLLHTAGHVPGDICWLGFMIPQATVRQHQDNGLGAVLKHVLNTGVWGCE